MKKFLISLLSLTCAFAICALVPAEAKASASSSYSLTLNTNGGTAYNVVQTNGQQGVRLPTPTKYGCEFLGWYDNASFSGSALSEIYVPTGNNTVYAKWSTPNYPTVTFNSNGGTSYKTLNYTGVTIALPTPQKLDYTFDGWYENSSFSGTKLGETYNPTKSVTLYAKWVAIDYPEVTFVSNCNTSYSVTTSNSVGINLPTPTKEGYTFGGWFTNSSFTGSSVSGVYKPTANTTLYAKWTAVPTYTVTLNANGGLTDANVKGLQGSTKTLPIPTKYGYHFDGWFTTSSFTGSAVKSITFSANTTLYAKWTEVKYLYLYKNYSNDCERLEYAPNTKLLTSDLPKPDAFVLKGVSCPFVRWTDENGKALYNTITLSNHVSLVAEYDLSNAPIAKYLKDNGNGTYTSTNGKQVWGFQYTETNSGKYSVNFTTNKSSSGAPGIVFRLTLGLDAYPFEGGKTSYISATMTPSSGALQIGRVLNGNWTALKTIELANMPSSWQNKYNAASTSLSFKLTVESYGDAFKIYVDDVLATTYTDSAAFSALNGTGWGIRNSVTDGSVTFSNVKTYSNNLTYNTSFTNNGGTYTTTATSVTLVKNTSSTAYTYSAKVSFYKDNGGGLGITWRMKYDGTKLTPYEDGVYYFAAVLCPSDGSLQISITESSKRLFAKLRANVALTDLNSAYQTAYNAGGLVTATIKVIDYGTSFEIYVNNEKEFTYSDSFVLSSMTGTGVGLRCSSKATTTGTPSISSVSLTENTSATALTNNVETKTSTIAIAKTNQVVLPKKEVTL